MQRILTELHLIDLNVRPSSVQNDGPLSNLVRLSFCLIQPCMHVLNTDQRSTLQFYVLFNSQGHIGTDPQHCHLWESNPTQR